MPGPVNFNVGMTKDRNPKNKEAMDASARKRLYNETEKILQPYK